MNQTFKMTAIAAALAVASGAAVANQFAGSNTADPTLKYLSTSATTNAKTISDVVIQELGTGGFNDGYFTVRIPATVAVNKTDGSALARTTTVWGTSASPKPLKVTSAAAAGGTASTFAASIYLGTTNTDTILTVAATDTAGGAIDGYWYNPAGTAANVNVKTGNTEVANWSTLASVTAVDTQVGQAYLDTTTNEIVLTFAMKAQANNEKVTLSGFSFSPVTVGSTGTVALKLENSAVSGATQQPGITEDSSVPVLGLSSNPVSVTGTTASTIPASVPVVPRGVVAPQKNGQVKIVAIGDKTTDNTNTVKLTLNNGAKWVTTLDTSANTVFTSSVGDIQTAIRLAANVALNAAGNELTLTLATMTDMTDGAGDITLVGNSDVLDVSGVTADGDITVTVTGTGDFAGASGSTVIAKAATKGSTVAFLDDSTSGYTTLFTGRKPTLTGEGLTLAETAYGTLPQYGQLTLSLSNGAKFATGGAAAASATTSGNNGALALDAFPTLTTAAATVTTTVGTPSSVTNGAGSVDIKNLLLDLTAATAGDLTVSLSGNSGATGSQKVAEIKDATNTSTSGSVTTAVVGSTFTLPDIVITEAAKGAIPDTDSIVVLLPEGSTLQTGTSSLADATATGAVTGVTVKAVKADGTDVTSTIFGSSPSITAQTATSGVGTLAIAMNSASSVAGVAAPVTITISGVKYKPVSTQTGDIDVYVTSVPDANIGDAVSTIITPTGVAGTAAATGASLKKVKGGSVVSSTNPSYPTVTVADVTKAVLAGIPLVAAGNDQGKQGAIYVAFIYNGTVFFMDNAQTWKLYTGATPAAYATGTLGSASIDVLKTATDLSSLKGGQLIVGYGLGIAGLGDPFKNMLDNVRYNVAYEVK